MISIYTNILKRFKDLYYIILIKSYIIITAKKIKIFNRILVLKIKKLINIQKKYIKKKKKIFLNKNKLLQ